MKKVYSVHFADSAAASKMSHIYCNTPHEVEALVKALLNDDKAYIWLQVQTGFGRIDSCTVKRPGLSGSDALFLLQGALSPGLPA